MAEPSPARDERVMAEPSPARGEGVVFALRKLAGCGWWCYNRDTPRMRHAE